MGLGCSDMGPEPASITIEPLETFIQPNVVIGGGLENYPYDVSTEIDVVVRNLTDTTVYLDRCVPSDSTPVFGIKRQGNVWSPLSEARVCISAPPYEIGARESHSIRLIARTYFECGVIFCDLWEPDTWGYHRVVVYTAAGPVSSQRFYLRSPIIFD